MKSRDVLNVLFFHMRGWGPGLDMRLLDKHLTMAV